MDVVFKHSRIKQYLKQGRAYRIETVINQLTLPSRPGCSTCPSWSPKRGQSTTACL